MPSWSLLRSWLLFFQIEYQFYDIPWAMQIVVRRRYVLYKSAYQTLDEVPFCDVSFLLAVFSQEWLPWFLWSEGIFEFDLHCRLDLQLLDPVDFYFGLLAEEHWFLPLLFRKKRNHAGHCYLIWQQAVSHFGRKPRVFWCQIHRETYLGLRRRGPLALFFTSTGSGFTRFNTGRVYAKYAPVQKTFFIQLHL